MRLSLAAALSLALAVPAAAQGGHGVLAAYGTGGGSTSLTEARRTLHAGYAIGGTGPTGAYAATRVIGGVHWLDPDLAVYRERWGEDGEVEGGEGTLTSAGVDVEVGWKLGPVRPYWHSGYHYHRQRIAAATFRGAAAAIATEPDHAETFARGSGYGAALVVGPAAVYAERFRGAGKGGVMRVSGTRFGARVTW